jgi:hypothetical protein
MLSARRTMFGDAILDTVGILCFFPRRPASWSRPLKFHKTIGVEVDEA